MKNLICKIWRIRAFRVTAKCFAVTLSGILVFFLTLKIIPYPRLEALMNQPYSTRIYDRNGALIQVTVLQDGLRREFTPENEIPKSVKKIFIKAEDKRFYFHHGVDYIAAFKAFFQNASAKKTVRGASTITMQLAKIISPASEHSFSKKITDVINAYRIEAKLTKKQILELYLNSVPFGMNSEGITSAARAFYGTELKELSEEQICCLATIPRRPTLYNPIKNPNECAKKAFLIEKKLNHKAEFTQVQKAASSARQFKYPFYMPHYVFYLQKNNYKEAKAVEFPKTNKISSVRNSLKNKKTFSESMGNFIQAPYKVTISLDLAIQTEAENLVMQALEMTQNSRISNAALLLLDNFDGSVLAWIGNGSWFDSEHNGQIDGVLVKNQPGSSMKPFLYALALEQTDSDGKHLYSPASILADIPSEFGRERLYIPSNFNNRFNGPIRFRVALASSLNIPAVTILNDIGVEKYLEKLYELGFESLKEKGLAADLGLALGAGEVSLKELTTAFCVFSRDGKDFSQKQIYSKDTARLICSILSDKASRVLGFGYSQTFETDYPSIFKTGTSNQYQDIVALGATKHFTIGVWMGNFSGETVMGKTGSSLPAWVAKKTLDFIEKDSKMDMDFALPEHWHKVKICSLSGLAASPDCPACVYEFIQDGTELAQCSWHKAFEGQLRTLYPAEYQQWARQYNQNALINYASAPLKLVTPKDNSLFYYSDLYSQKQAIPVEVSGGFSDELTVTYDGKIYKRIMRPFVFTLPVEKGNHVCSLESDIENTSFSFVVK